MVATSLVGLALTPFILNYISKEEYALYYIASDILIWLGIIQLGVSPAFTSMAGHLIGANKLDNLPRVASTAWVLQLCSAILVIIAGFIISFFLSHWFSTEQQIKDLQLMFLTLVLTSAVALSVQIYSSLLVANKQIYIDNLIRIIILVPSVILTVIFLKNGFKLLGLALTGLFTTVINLLINIQRVKHIFPTLKLNVRLFNIEDAKSLVQIGVWFSLGGVAGILILNLDKIVLGKFLSLSVVTSFVITNRLYSLADKILGHAINVSRVYISQLHGKQDYKNLYDIYYLSTIFSLLIGGLVSCTIFFANKYFITWWVGAEYYIGDQINLLLAVNFLLQLAVLPNRALLASTFFRIKEQNVTRIVEGLFNLALSLLLVNYFAVEGLLLASILTTILMSNILLNRFCNELFQNQKIVTDWKMYLAYLMVVLPVVIYIIDQAFPSISIVVSLLIISMASLSIIYFMWKSLNSIIPVANFFSFSKAENGLK